MEVTTVINREALNETKKYLVPSFPKKMLNFFEILYIVLAVIAFVGYGSYLTGGLCILLLIIFWGIYKYSENKLVKMNLKSLETLTGKDSVESKMTFEENKVIFYGVTGKQRELLYPEFVTYGETDNYYVLYTKNLSGGIIKKESITEVNQERFETYLEKMAFHRQNKNKSK